uniref:Large ribosomal subunit protein bL36m n=1 Tax=Pseudodiaptomus poplesia TaxID=213370 RepID=A0A0U2IGD0_9MAXI|nr:mitochondrial putative 39S ribosomal protein L36 [Pseudodiaptomus poplesia]
MMAWLTAQSRHYVTAVMRAANAQAAVKNSLLLPNVGQSCSLQLSRSICSLRVDANKTGQSSLKFCGTLLKPTSSQLIPSAGLKHVGVPTLRCRHCYFVVKDEVKYVMCTAKPRHQQAQKMIAAKFGNMILTHATQGVNKKNNGRGSRNIKTQSSFRLDF